MKIEQGNRILFLQRSLPPDHSAAGALIFELARELAVLGFRPILVGTTAAPDVPLRETREGVEFLRVRAGNPSRTSTGKRLLALALAQIKLWPTLLRVEKPSLLVTWTDPPLSEIPGGLLARWWWKIPHLHWCQDLYPETALAAGVFSANQPTYPIYKLLQLAARRARERAQATISIGRCMSEVLGERSFLLPNWTRISADGVSDGAGGSWRDDLDLGSRTLVLYSGNIGWVHDFDALLSAVHDLRQEPFLFVVAGDGPRRADLKKALAGESQVRFLPPLPREKYEELLAAADIHLVTLRREFCGLVVPSKFYDVAATGRAVVFVGPEKSECALALREKEAGWVVPDGPGPALGETLRLIREQPDETARRGDAARKTLGSRRVGQATREFLVLLDNLPAG